MFYLSQILAASVENRQGVRTARLIDVLAPVAQSYQAAPTYPQALVIEGQDAQHWRVPATSVDWDGNTLHLRIPIEQLAVQSVDLAADEVSLAHDVLDKQVIDIVHKKAVRVNDICFGSDWQILGIDNSTLGLVRRLAPAWLLGTRGKHPPARLITWEQLELLSTHHYAEPVTGGVEASQPHVQRQPSGHLTELHPADIAEIVHQLTPGQGARLIEGLDNETAADTMEEIDTELQRHILESISADRAADILEAMGPDEAADLLAQLPEERAQELLKLMTPEESEDVQELLEYEEDSAGGLMTTDYIILNTTKSAAEALAAVRTNIQEQDIHAAYVYCVTDETVDECTLLGVISVWDLLVAPAEQLLQDMMETDLISVQPTTDPRDVAQIMAKYNLLAVPVLSETGILEGIVTIDDALDVLLPPDKRRKPTRMY